MISGEIIRWGLLIFLLILIVFQLSGITALLRRMQKAITLIMVRMALSDFENVDIKKAFSEVMEDDKRRSRNDDREGE